MSGLKKSRALVMVIVFSMMLSLLASSFVYAGTGDTTTIVGENVDITRTVSKTKLLLNDEVTITYTITPRDIPVEEQPLVKKEILLVVDASTSMKNNNITYNKTRLQVAQEVANDFINKLAGLNNTNPGSIKAGMVTFNSVAYVKQYGGKVLSDNFNDINNDINTLKYQVAQGTNIGDALRRGYYELTKGDPEADKYIVLLSDGEASYFSGVKDNKNKVIKINGKHVYFTSDGASKLEPVQSFWNDYKLEREEYCYVIADMIEAYNNTNAKKIKPFMIAYGNEADKAVLLETANRAGGSSSDVYEAELADDLVNVFTTISDEIAKDYKLQNIYFEETIPDGFALVEELGGFEMDGQKLPKTISSIEYKLNVAKTHYVADPITFSFTLKCTATGSYTFGNATLEYDGITGDPDTINFPPYTIDVYANTAPITVSRTITPTNTIIDSDVYSTYTISPGTFTVDPDLYDGALPGTLTVSGIKLYETLPEGLTAYNLPGNFTIDAHNNLTAILPPIVYTKNAADQYVASDISLEFPIIPTETGTYEWDGEIVYDDLDGLVKTKSFTGGPLNVSEYGTPTIVIESITKKGDKVDIKVKYTLPSFTANATIVKNGDGLTPVSLPLTNGYSTFYDLSIYEDHTAIITATSTTGVSRPVELLIYEAIDVN